jgi:hypothetical protein
VIDPQPTRSTARPPGAAGRAEGDAEAVSPMHAIELPLPTLPAAMDGLRIVHLSDLHVRRTVQGARWESRVRSWERVLAREPADLVALTGDYCDDLGHEQAAAEVLGRLVAATPARTPLVGVFGNHDTSPMRELAAGLPRVKWLDNSVVDLPVRGGAGGVLRVIGLSYPEDALAAALAGTEAARGVAAGFTVALSHYPSMVVPAADLGWPLVLAGHTHGGQVRVSGSVVPHTACDLPTHLASGCLRLGSTLCCISRGLGDGGVPGLRINCPPQAPLYTLRRGPLPGGAEPTSGGALRQVMLW